MDSLEIDELLRIPAGRHALPAQEVARLQRERMVRAVILCTAQDGYSATTIADIVARAEVSRTAFYEQFAGKEECFLSAYAQMATAMREAVIATTTTAGVGRSRRRNHHAQHLSDHPVPALHRAGSQSRRILGQEHRHG